MLLKFNYVYMRHMLENGKPPWSVYMKKKNTIGPQKLHKVVATKSKSFRSANSVYAYC